MEPRPPTHPAPPRSRRLLALLALTLLSALGALTPGAAGAHDHRAGSTPAHAWLSLPALPPAADTDRRAQRETQPHDPDSPLVPLDDPRAPRRRTAAPGDPAWTTLAGWTRTPRARAPPA
ncbi:MAG: hypothetical protein ACIARR_10955 [Phycisphaerales bacterium JB059]